MNQYTTQPEASTSTSEIEVHLNFTARVGLDGTSPKAIEDLLELAAQRMMSEGMVTGHTSAYVEQHDAAVFSLTRREAELNADEIVAFYNAEINKGALPDDEVIPRLVALALQSPAEVRRNLAKMIDDEKQFA